MKLSLENFKCYTSAEFDLGENGITLIKGNSGKGKTTILDGIYYALYGKGMKLLKSGQKSCKVVLSTHSLEITRTKGPNRLVVKRGDDIYEDAAGQGVIDNTFTNNYDGTGYMKQNDTNSFILLSPTDKLHFIEQYAFDGLDIQTYKARIKDVVKERDIVKEQTSAQLQLTTDVLTDKEEPVSIDPPRITDKKVIHKKIKKCEENIEKTKETSKHLNLKKTEWARVQTFVQTTTDSITSLQKDLPDAPPKEDELITIDNKLKTHEKALEAYIRNKQILSDYNQLQKDIIRTNEMYQKAKNDLLQKRDALTAWPQQSKEECKHLMEEYKIYIQKKREHDDCVRKLKTLTFTNIDDIEHEITRLEQTISDAEISNKMYACPACKKTLCISHGVLRDCTEKTIISEKEYTLSKQTLKSLKKQRDNAQISNHTINNLRETIESFTEKDVSDITSYYETNIQLDIEIKRLQHQIDNDDILKDVRNNIKQRQQFFQDVPVDSNIDEESLRKDIQRLKEHKTSIKQRIDSYNHITHKLNTYKASIESCKKAFIDAFGETSNNDIDYELKACEDTLQKLTQKMAKYKDNQIQIEKYNQYQSDYKDYTSWCTKYDTLRDKEIDDANKLCSVNILRDMVADAESLAIKSVMLRIEDIVQDYLNLFFIEDPITIKLHTFKEDTKKKTKAQINVTIDYKGMECTTSQLSGGERQRIMLAFNLGMSEIYNLPFIMLDETMSNLDEETTQIIVDGLKERCSNKLVIIIAHQVVSGIFDKTINI